MSFNCNDEWESYCSDTFDLTINDVNKFHSSVINNTSNTFPKSSQIYISTTTKISYLSNKSYPRIKPTNFIFTNGSGVIERRNNNFKKFINLI